MKTKEIIERFNLNSEQTINFNAIEWLMFNDKNYVTDPPDRTHLMICIFIKRAIENPSEWVYLYDHNKYGFQSDERMLKSVMNILKKYFNDIYGDFKFNDIKHTFVYEPSDSITNFERWAKYGGSLPMGDINKLIDKSKKLDTIKKVLDG